LALYSSRSTTYSSFIPRKTYHHPRCLIEDTAITAPVLTAMYGAYVYVPPKSGNAARFFIFPNRNH
jgi:hypothetical protein